MHLDFGEFLARGYLPKELPPCFTSTSFRGADRAALLAAIGSKPQATNHAMYDLGRPGGNRRDLHLVHPRAMIQLVDVLVDRWASLRKLFAKSPLGKTRPEPRGTTGRYLKRSPGFKERKAEQLRMAAEARYCLRVDVQDCYRSVYTHTLPWVLHGRATAKARRNDDSLLGNALDRAVRLGQDGQTMGIPVGPDTSFALAELILSKVDAGLPDVRGARYMDDYEFYLWDRSRVDEVLQAVQSELSKYELSLNTRKTAIVELPDVLWESWQDRIRHAELQKSEDLLTFFNEVFAIKRDHPHNPVLHYALGRLVKDEYLGEAECTLIEHFALACVAFESGTLPAAAEILSRRDETRDDETRDTVFRTLGESAALRRRHEVSWGLWLACNRGWELPDGLVRRIADVADPISHILLLEAHQQGLCTFKLPLVRRRELSSGFRGSDWILAYYCRRTGKLKSKKGAVPLEAELLKQGVAFVRPDRLFDPGWPDPWEDEGIDFDPDDFDDEDDDPYD